MPILAASFKLKPNSNAVNIATKTPIWAAAPNNKLLGSAIIGPKSVIAPRPKNIKRGTTSVSIK
ncbi:hypothetical protein D1872_343550 [compost metagenome]